MHLMQKKGIVNMLAISKDFLSGLLPRHSMKKFILFQGLQSALYFHYFLYFFLKNSSTVFSRTSKKKIRIYAPKLKIMRRPKERS